MLLSAGGMTDKQVPFGKSELLERFDPSLLRDIMGVHGHSGHLKFEYQGHGDDWVEMAMDWREDLVVDEESGALASAAIFSLMDNATSQAVWTRVGKFRPHATMDMRIDYLRPSPPGARVFGRGECYHLTSTVSFVRGIAHNGDPADPVAHVAGTFICTEGYLK